MPNRATLLTAHNSSSRRRRCRRELTDCVCSLQYLEGKAQLLYPEPADVFPVSCCSAVSLSISICLAAEKCSCRVSTDMSLVCQQRHIQLSAA